MSAASAAAREAPRLLGDFIPWRDVAKVAPHVFNSPGRVRHLLRTRDRNGLAPHLLWVGREPFITADALRAWLASRTEAERSR